MDSANFATKRKKFELFGPTSVGLVPLRNTTERIANIIAREDDLSMSICRRIIRICVNRWAKQC